MMDWLKVAVWGGLATLTIFIWSLTLIGAHTLLVGGCS
jgi:hypothetical protein